jgi:multiple sugar transport system substrate-binding protein
MPAQSNGSAFTRRGFLGVAGGATAAAFLAACSTGGGGKTGSGGSSGSIKFWNMPWGPDPKFKTLDGQIATSYKPKSGLPSVTYQEIQWANFTQTFSSAVASGTNPAISSGGGTQALLFESQGKIAYADDLLDSWKKNGLYDDFLPGLVDTLKTKNGYAAVPYNLDMRVWWYNKTLLDKAGVKPPTTWDEYEKACAALKKIGVYGYGTQAGAGANTGFHSLVSHMINNGGGLFDEKHQPNCVTKENIDAMNWVIGLIKNGYVDPRSASYTSANSQAQWTARKFGMGWDTAGVNQSVGGTVGTQEMVVGSPLVGPSGKKGALYFPNNIMMYKKTPSKAGTEAFATYYYQHMSKLWTTNLLNSLPPLKSIANTPEFKKNTPLSTAVTEWQPISKTWGAPGGNTVFLNVTAVDGTPASYAFAQSILTGKATAREALTTLQNALKSVAKPNG